MLRPVFDIKAQKNLRNPTWMLVNFANVVDFPPKENLSDYVQMFKNMGF